MPKMYLRQPGFTYSAGKSFTEYKEEYKKLKKTADSQYIYHKMN